MDKKTKLKEAIKVALAFTLAYMIALKINWMNPQWAAFAVAMCIFNTAGQSLHKMILRLVGTIPGVLAGFAIFAIAAQDRWLLALLGSVWIGFTSYRMSRSKNSVYAWQVAGFVALIVLTVQPIASESIFHLGLYRALETALGIVVYGLVTTLLWPRTNYGSIKKTSLDLLNAQLARFQATNAVLENKEEVAKLAELRTNNVKQITALNSALVAEGSESYEVTEVRPVYERFMEISKALAEVQNRIEFHIEDFDKIHINSVIPELAAFNQDLEERFKAMQHMISTDERFEPPESWSFTINKDAFAKLSQFEKASVETGIQNLRLIEQYTSEMYICIMEITGNVKLSAKPTPSPEATAKDWYLNLIPYSEGLRGGIYAGFAVFLGFCIYYFINPIGHSGWFQLTASLALIIAASPQVRIAPVAKAIAIVFPFYILIYIFILPHLSGGLQFFIFMFLLMFSTRFLFSGVVQAMGGLALVMVISIKNPQVFSFVGVFGAYVFTVTAIYFVYAVTYLVGAARPEKQVLRFTRRYFKSAKYLLAQLANTQEGREFGVMDKIRLTWHRNQVNNLAGRISIWSKAIDHKLFPNVTPEQINTLTESLQLITLGVDELFASKYNYSEPSGPEHDLRIDLEEWNRGLQEVFNDWSIAPDKPWKEGKQEKIKTWLETLETKMQQSVNNIADPTSVKLDHFYNILVSYRGLTSAVANYARVAPGIDLQSWKEEKFS